MRSPRPFANSLEMEEGRNIQFKRFQIDSDGQQAAIPFAHCWLKWKIAENIWKWFIVPEVSRKQTNFDYVNCQKIGRPRAKFWVSSAARQKNLKLFWLCNFSTFENLYCLSLTWYTVKYQTFTYKICIFRRRLWRSLFSQCTEPLNGIKIAFLLLYANLSPSELFAPRPEHRPSTTSGSWLGRGI